MSYIMFVLVKNILITQVTCFQWGEKILNESLINESPIRDFSTVIFGTNYLLLCVWLHMTHGSRPLRKLRVIQAALSHSPWVH